MIRSGSATRLMAASTLLAATALSVAAWAAPGDLDPGFGDRGKVVRDLGKLDDASDIAVQGDGRIVAVGDVGPFLRQEILVARFRRGGGLDPSFSDNGKQIVRFPGRSDFPHDVAIQDDGKILVVGEGGSTHTTYGDGYSPRVARLTPRGRLDRSFGDEGVAALGIGSVSGSEGSPTADANAIALQPDDKIVVAGWNFEGDADPDFVVARLLPDGRLDPSFSDDGISADGAPDGIAAASDVAVAADGRILVCGRSASGGDMVVAAYQPDGSLDTTFSGGGVAVADLGGNEFAESLALLTGGDIAVAGTRLDTGSGERDFAVARFDGDGTLDAAFSGDGLHTVDFHGRADIAHAVVPWADKLVVVGSASTPRRSSDFGVARLDADGTLDAGFSGEGKRTTNFRKEDEAWDAELTAGDRLIVGGWTRARGAKRDDPQDSALARYRLR